MMNVELLKIDHPRTCHIISRRNRFVVRICIDGKEHDAWINNSGRLEDFLHSGVRGYCVSKPGGKTAFRLFAVQHGTAAALIDTAWQMQAFEEAIQHGAIPWLSTCQLVQREVVLGDSRIDYLLDCGSTHQYLEVKSAVLQQGCTALYPDCPSARGRKHVMELTRLAEYGAAPIILFIAALPAMESFSPNMNADFSLYEALQQAAEVGVNLKAIGMYYAPLTESVILYNPDLPVHWNFSD